MITLKRRYPNRARPSQIWPTLFPPVPVPGHAPYPAGHALIGHLTSECLAEAVPKHKKALEELAIRCALNRVYAGLHFHEDNTAGAQAAAKIHLFMKECQLYKDTLAEAKNECL
jgi:acid phosphatase (class A)